jgi:hypothetical protein
LSEQEKDVKFALINFISTINENSILFFSQYIFKQKFKEQSLALRKEQEQKLNDWESKMLIKGKYKLIRKTTLKKLETNLANDKLKINKMRLTAFRLRNKKLKRTINEKQKLLHTVIGRLKKKTTPNEKANILKYLNVSSKNKSTKSRKIRIIVKE